MEGLGVMRSIARDFHAARQNCLASFRGFARFGIKKAKNFRLITNYSSTRQTLNYAQNPNLAKPLLSDSAFLLSANISQIG